MRFTARAFFAVSFLASSVGSGATKASVYCVAALSAFQLGTPQSPDQAEEVISRFRLQRGNGGRMSGEFKPLSAGPHVLSLSHGKLDTNLAYTDDLVRTAPDVLPIALDTAALDMLTGNVLRPGVRFPESALPNAAENNPEGLVFKTAIPAAALLLLGKVLIDYSPTEVGPAYPIVGGLAVSVVGLAGYYLFQPLSVIDHRLAGAARRYQSGEEWGYVSMRVPLVTRWTGSRFDRRESFRTHLTALSRRHDENVNTLLGPDDQMRSDDQQLALQLFWDRSAPDESRGQLLMWREYPRLQAP